MRIEASSVVFNTKFDSIISLNEHADQTPLIDLIDSENGNYLGAVQSISDYATTNTCRTMVYFTITTKERNYLVLGPEADWMKEMAADLRPFFGLN